MLSVMMQKYAASVVHANDIVITPACLSHRHRNALNTLLQPSPVQQQLDWRGHDRASQGLLKLVDMTEHHRGC